MGQLVPVMEGIPIEINIITLNCWGLKYLSKLRRERLCEIGRQLAIAEPRPSIVGLQELWTQEDYQAIRRETQSVLPYGKFYFSGILGGGLAILSRWPIEESSMFRYPLNGRPTAFFRGDWYVGKGVACARIRYGPAAKQVIEVFNTHTHAPYESGPNDSYLCHRNAQAWEIAKLMKGAAERGHLVLTLTFTSSLGDFNMVPSSIAYQLITGHAPVRDTWRILHPDSSLGRPDDPAEQARNRPVPTAEFNLLANGIASDGPYCTWRWNKNLQNRLLAGKPVPPVNPDEPDPRGKRLDYVFAGSGDVAALGGCWTVRRVAVGMTMRHPQLRVSLSDHFAVEATLAFVPLRPEVGTISRTEQQNVSGLRTGTKAGSGIAMSSEILHGKDGSTAGSLVKSDDDVSTNEEDPKSGPLELAALAVPKPDPLPLATYDEILDEIRRYRVREQQQERWRGWHFFFWVFVWVGSLVSIWFVAPRASYGAFILMLVSSLGLVGGTIDGLLSFMFFRWELRALREFEWEITNAKAAAGGGPALVGTLQGVQDGTE